MIVGYFVLLLSIAVAYEKACSHGMYILSCSVRRIRNASGRMLLLFVRPLGRRSRLSSFRSKLLPTVFHLLHLLSTVMNSASNVDGSDGGLHIPSSFYNLRVPLLHDAHFQHRYVVCRLHALPILACTSLFSVTPHTFRKGRTWIRSLRM